MESTLDPQHDDLGPIGAVRQTSLSEEVTGRIREAIVTGVLKPGQHLREAELSEALDVSRSPIRDAFATLHHEGLVTVRHHHGAVVVGVTAPEIDDLFILRRSLETLAATLAANRATEHDVEALKLAATEVPNAPGKLRAREYADADVTFHDLLYQSAHHRRLYACWTNVRPHVARFLLSRNIADADYDAHFASDHLALVDAIAKHNANLAGRMVEAHILGSYRKLVDHYGGPMTPKRKAGTHPLAQVRISTSPSQDPHNGSG